MDFRLERSDANGGTGDVRAGSKTAPAEMEFYEGHTVGSVPHEKSGLGETLDFGASLHHCISV
jgi:hypothetical protein